MTQLTLFPRNAPTSDTGAGDARRTPDNRGRSARGHRQTLRQRRALQRLAERQAWFDRTRSNTALQRLRDAVTDALRLGV